MSKTVKTSTLLQIAPVGFVDSIIADLSDRYFITPRVVDEFKGIISCSLKDAEFITKKYRPVAAESITIRVVR